MGPGCFCGGQPALGGGGFGFNVGLPSAQVQLPGFGFNAQGPTMPQFGVQGQWPMMQPMMGGGMMGGGGMGGGMQMPMPGPMPGMGGQFQMGQTFNPYNPQANAYGDAYAVVRQSGWNRAMKWALGGTLTGSLLVMGMYFFMQWWNANEQLNNAPQVQAPANPVSAPPGNANAGNTRPNFSWTNPSGVPPGVGRPWPQPRQSWQPPGIVPSHQSQQFPGLPISYLNGGFGWFVATEQKIVYIAHDAGMNEQVSARAFVQDRQLKGELWRILVVMANAAGTEPARPPAGGHFDLNIDGTMALTYSQRRQLLMVLLDAKRHTEAMRDQIRGETQLRYHLTPKHHQTLDPDIDGSISSIDEAIGMVRGGRGN
jgi:hypothetical protein